MRSKSKGEQKTQKKKEIKKEEEEEELSEDEQQYARRRIGRKEVQFQRDGRAPAGGTALGFLPSTWQ